LKETRRREKEDGQRKRERQEASKEKETREKERGKIHFLRPFPSFHPPINHVHPTQHPTPNTCILVILSIVFISGTPY
jgi:hypothetical protein